MTTFADLQQQGVARPPIYPLPSFQTWGGTAPFVQQTSGQTTATRSWPGVSVGTQASGTTPIQPPGQGPLSNQFFFSLWQQYQQPQGFQYSMPEAWQMPQYQQGGQQVGGYQYAGQTPQYQYNPQTLSPYQYSGSFPLQRQGGNTVQAYQGQFQLPSAFQGQQFQGQAQAQQGPAPYSFSPFSYQQGQPFAAPAATTSGTPQLQAGQIPQFTATYQGIGAPQLQQAGAFTPQASPLQSQLEQTLAQALGNPSAYTSENVASQFDILNRRLGQGFDVERQRINEEMARRGLHASTVAGGRLGDLATNQAQAQADLAQNLLDQSAARYGQDRSAAIAQAMGYGGMNFGNQLAAYQANLAGSGQNFQQDLAARAFQGDQRALEVLNSLQQATFGRESQGQNFAQQLAGANLGLQAQNQQFGQQLAGQQFGQSEAARQFGQGQQAYQTNLGGQQQAFGQDLAARAMAGDESARALMSNLQIAQFNAGQGQQGFANQLGLIGLQSDLGQQGFQNQLAAQGFNQGLGQQHFQNQLAQAMFGQDVGQQGFQNQLATQGFQRDTAQQAFQNALAQATFGQGVGQQGFQNQLAAQGFNQGLGQQAFQNAMQQFGTQNDLSQQGFQNALAGYGANLGASQLGFNQQQQMLANLLGYGQQQFGNWATQEGLRQSGDQTGMWANIMSSLLPLFMGGAFGRTVGGTSIPGVTQPPGDDEDVWGEENPFGYQEGN